MGSTLAMVRAYLNTALRASELGLFMDWGSLPQKPRTEEETRSFAAALQVMLSLYASVTGTAVLQCKHVPERPACFDGCLCLYDEFQEGEVIALRDELARLLQSEGWAAVGCAVELIAATLVPRLRFDTHEQAHSAPSGCCVGRGVRPTLSTTSGRTTVWAGVGGASPNRARRRRSQRT